ncbi:putative subtilisin-like serine protease, subtilase family [Nonlabens dokdonensis DSW-6]|uniref:Putative subtilisin-like serine protease, subtilase family n=1 Tax=Nonlabens dokdonensis (strain DSM 17205 / KCTC 12402 / DSW-6) TaxID=592029 RepID=L7W974_NONDD|nr:putative subtilisin-like serine protease, subtilase family [Nonlabens dokdonensis DSW-6]
MFTIAATGFLVSCGSGGAIVSPPIGNIDSTPLKTQELTEEQAKNWKDYDLVTDTIPGMSINKAYTEILKGKKGKTVIVAVIDSGIDVEHEDLDDVIWTNEDEIPNNGKDDDNNGYIDDIHGWNFLGDIVDENLEYERIVRDKAMLPADMVAKAQKEYDKKVEEAAQQKAFYEQQIAAVKGFDAKLEAATGKEDYTLEDVNAVDAGDDQELVQAKGIAGRVFPQYESFKALIGLLQDEVDGLTALLNGDKIKTNYRKDILNDDPYTWDTPVYGNNEYSGPDPEKADAFHGTHVAGIIAAERDNGLGVNGVANNVEIMVLRAVSQADEYDKDIAKAIRYAADNGATVINGSFGKYHSTNPEWVWEAIKYAESKDVLFVNAAGNEGIDTDFTQVYPQDQELAGAEISDNFITVGALNYEYGSGLLANFSNYGKSSVDVFAPGVAIYSTAPNNEYRNAGGTSMAAPATAGVAAVIRSQYPKLTAAQVKQVIMDSGLTTSARVVLGGNAEDMKPFGETTVSGKMVNLYNALILASKM